VEPEKFSADYLAQHPNLEAIAKQTAGVNAAIEALQRETAKPVPYSFVIRRAP